MPENIKDLNDSNVIYLDLQIALNEYINSLDTVELLALNVARQQLESSFELHKSIGFLNYIKNNNIHISNK